MKTAEYTEDFVLIAEDDDDDYLLAYDALSKLGLQKQVKRVTNGEDLLNFLRSQPPYDTSQQHKPAVIFLDLYMPKMNGDEALKIIKSDPNLKSIPVVVLSTSNVQKDIDRSKKLNANSFFQKPNTFNEIIELYKSVTDYWFNRKELAPIPISEC